MKKFFTIAIVITFCFFGVNAQERYLDEIFTDVNVDSDVTYGVNGTLLFLPQVGEVVPQELKMDVYTPEGDTETSRPLVLVFHTGNFLPSVTNGQISGTKVDSSVVEICKQLARRGYVAASVDYRLGWNPLAPTQPERALGLIQAAYRGVQDGRTAVRYFKKDVAENNNSYGIDPDRITCFGTGTGGYITLAMATLDSYNEILNTTNSPGKFLLDVNQDGIPETPMVIQPFHGDIEGKVLTVTPPDGSSMAFGIPANDTTNYPNHVEYDSDFNLCVNIGGALGDVSWLDTKSTPIITVHSINDMFAPYGDAVLVVPTTGDPIVQVQGGSINIPVAVDSSLQDAMIAANFNDETTTMAEENSATAGHPYFEGLFPWDKPANSLGLDEGVVLNWWDPNAPAPGAGMNIPWNMLPHPSGGTFHDQGLVLNEGMSAEKSKANIDLSLSYITPRMCVVLDLPCANMFTSTEEVVLDADIMSISPNPSLGDFTISTNGEIMEKIAIFGINGKSFGVKNNVNASEVTFYRENLPAGIYFVKAYIDGGVATQKVILK